MVARGSRAHPRRSRRRCDGRPGHASNGDRGRPLRHGLDHRPRQPRRERHAAGAEAAAREEKPPCGDRRKRRDPRRPHPVRRRVERRSHRGGASRPYARLDPQRRGHPRRCLPAVDRKESEGGAVVRALAGLLRKEFIAFVTNRTFIVIVGLPVLIAVFFGLAFGNERPLATVAVVRPADERVWSRAKTDLGSVQTLQMSEVTTDFSTAIDIAERGRVSGVLDLRGLTLEGDRLAGRIGVSVDELRPVSAEVIRATVAAWIAAAGPPQPVATSLTVLRGVSPRQATIPLWLVAITLIIGISTMPLTLTEEREHRTLRALLVAPVSRWSLLIGKGGIGVAMIVAMTALTLVLNRTPIASPLPLALVILAGALAFVPIGLTLGALAPSQNAASPFAGLLLIALLLPVTLSQTEAPGISDVARWLPSTALASGVRVSIVTAISLADVLPQIAYLVAVAVIGAAAARWAIGREAVVLG
ncbi:MAG: ABC transporter permease [Chloroflexi bacterium]|nr:MAG: ABC transporter permease [Chloroflexota bacterium]